MIFIYRSHVNTTKVQHCMMVQSPITQAMSIKLLITERERERERESERERDVYI